MAKPNYERNLSYVSADQWKGKRWIAKVHALMEIRKQYNYTTNKQMNICLIKMHCDVSN